MAAPIRNEAAYEDAIRRRIIANAYKTWLTKTPRAHEIALVLRQKGETPNGYRDNFFGSLAKALNTYGKLSEKQSEAILRIMEKDAARKVEWDAEREEKKKLSQHVSEIGSREVFTLTCDHVVEMYTDFGWCGIHLLRDVNGNRFVYKGSKRLVSKDETVVVKATVKAHDEREGEKQTIITRPALV